LEAKALQGRGIVVTRPAGQAGPLARRIEAAGARPLLFPAMEIEPLRERPLPPLEGFDLAIFVSPTAVRCVLEQGAQWPPELRVAGVGKGTRRELEARGVRGVLAPDNGADSEALLALPALQEVGGKRILIVRGEGGREFLAETLVARGALVEHFECYRRLPPRTDPAPLAQAWDHGEVDALAVTSAEGFDNLVALFGPERLARTPLFVAHERIAEHARSAGVREVVVAGPGDEELVDALVAYFRPRMDHPQEHEQQSAPAQQPPRRSRAPWVLALLFALVAALGAAAWFDTRNRIDATQEELAHRLRVIETEAREARTAATQAQGAQREAQAKLTQLEARLAESQNQQLALEALYQELSRSRDEWQLAEVEQVLTTAAQQLQLAGNVRAALLALQLADERLARADRPQFAPVREALARDIERLKTLPAVDLPGLSARIEGVIAQIDSLPLALQPRPGPDAADSRREPPPAERPWWERLAAEVWTELRQLVVVRRVNTKDPLLIAPAEEYFLRENLRLRLLAARLSLLARDEAGFRQDLRAAQDWIERYFDPRSRQTLDALNQLKQLSAATLSFDMPTISDSLQAVRAFQARPQRAPK
jgi:uroporphyrinogen III methyltransferase / synthase